MATNQNEAFESIDDRIRRSRLFILGAGFSASAGVPLTSTLLERAMRSFLEECPEIFKRVEAHARTMMGSQVRDIDFSKTSFSDLCTFLEFVELREYGGGERWSDAGSMEKLALRFYLAKTISQSTPDPEDVSNLYTNFADQLSDNDIILSFNWDGLLENALRRVGKPYTYNFSEVGIKLCKLHGSINWRLGPPARHGHPVNSLGWQPLGFASGMMTDEIFFTSSLLDSNYWAAFSPFGEVEPFLVLPGYGKAFDVRSNATLWYKPEFAFGFTHDVFIIGLSLTQDDFFIRSLFLQNFPLSKSTKFGGRKAFVINPDPAIAGNYSKLLDGGSIEILNEPFCQSHLDLMKSRLRIE